MTNHSDYNHDWLLEAIYDQCLAADYHRLAVEALTNKAYSFACYYQRQAALTAKDARYHLFAHSERFIGDVP